jgi:RimJ/RimL family protein N-acetyltransferase
MIELEEDNFGKVLPLYQVGTGYFPLILAVIRQKQRGWVFTDNRDDPVSAMVITNFGFMHVTGTKPGEAFDLDLQIFLAAPEARLPSYLLWYSPPPEWQTRLDALTPDRIRRRERMRFVFDPSRAGYLAEPVQIPTGLDLRLLDDDLLAETAVFNLELGARFWSSPEDFMKNGFGVCLLRDGEIASLCYAACVVDGLAEIDIITREESRGQGLGAITAQYFIQECMRRGIVPTWDCFINNVASFQLAKRLGFEAKQPYFFYSFNVPVDFDGKAKGAFQ